MTQHWATRPQKPKEIDPREITEMVIKGASVYCGRCQVELLVIRNPIRIRRCMDCYPTHPNGMIGAWRIVEAKVYMDLMYGEYHPDKSILPIGKHLQRIRGLI